MTRRASLTPPRSKPPRPEPPPPTREAGLARLAAFAPLAGRAYGERRGLDLPAEGHPHVSRLSPYLRHRIVTEEEALAAAIAHHGREGASRFIEEVLWRTYFKGFLERRPALWHAFGAGLARARDRLATEAGLRRGWEAGCRGETGIAPFDAWAHELAETGYMHNHARMWFASIWCFTLRLPWELGADLFLRQLLDGDPASNTLSWRWVGGLHTPGKTYLATAANIARHSGGRWSGPLALAARAEPLAGTPNPPPGPAPRPSAWAATARSGLLLHEDDLSPEPILARLEPLAVASMSAARGRSPLEVSPGVRRFVDGALRHAAARLAPDAAGPCEEARDVAAWARAAGLDQVVTPYAPVGPVACALGRVEAALAAEGIALVRVMRPFDAAGWEPATHGYFRYRQRIPALLDAMVSTAAA